MRRREFVLFAGAAVFGSRAGSASAQSKPERTRIYEVRRDDRLVLTVSNEPGPLLSTALPPPGREPVSHPFLSASAYAPDEEPRLHEILERAKNFPDFLARLGAAGYALRERTGSSR
jgi:hypothetical protein